MEKANLAELESLAEAGRKRIMPALQKSVLTWIEGLLKTDKTPSKSDIYAVPFPDLDGDLVKTTERAIASSLLMGMRHADTKIELSDDFDLESSVENLPFEEAVDFFKSKVTLPKSEWQELEQKLRFRAFTVARLAECDFIEEARRRILHALEEGETLQDILTDIKDIVKKDGSDFKAGYWETVFRTNIQSSYNAGRLMQYRNNMPPAWELLVIQDDRTSDICKGIVPLAGNGRALRSDHPFWKEYGFPPYHFNCRTTFRAVYDYETGKTTEASDVPIEEIREEFKLQKGFGGNPIENGNWWMLTERQIERGIKYGIIGEFNREENVIADYNQVWKGYTRIKGKNGGWYDLCENPPDDWKKNKPVVEAMANAGYKVKVIPPIDNIKEKYKKDWSNPDVFVNGSLWDIKEPEKMTASAIKGRLVSTQKRQRLTKTVLNIPDEMPEYVLLNGIKRQANDPHNKITNILLVYKGTVKEFKLADFIIKKRAE